LKRGVEEEDGKGGKKERRELRELLLRKGERREDQRGLVGRWLLG